MDTPRIGVRSIVPLAGRPAVAPSAATPKLTYRGGELLTAVQVFTIFWGAAWQQPANSSIVTGINSMFDSILTSSLITLLQEYDVTGKTIGTGTRIGSTTIVDVEPGGTTGQVSDAQIQHALQGWISGTIPPPVNNNTLYFVYLPPGVSATDSQGDRSCHEMCGYHYYSNGPGGVRRIGVTNTDWRTTWSIIRPGSFGGGTGRSDLLFYDPTSGQGEFWRTDGHGNVSQIGVTNTDWRRSWSMIIPGNFGGGTGLTDLLFYDPSSGQGEFWRTDGHGNVSQIGVTNTGWRQSWALIVPGNYGSGSGQTDLLFYDRSAGQAEFFHTDARGRVHRIGWTTAGWRTSWSAILPGNYGSGTGQSDLLFYDPLAGQGEFYSTNGSSPEIFYAVEPHPDCTGCLPSPLDTLQALTTTSSHELCEAITDPEPGKGWYDDSNGEIGDICAWQTDTIDGFTVQQEWSNAQKACVIAPASVSLPPS